MTKKSQTPRVDIVIDTTKLKSAPLPDHYVSQVAQISEMARKVTQVHTPFVSTGLQESIRQYAILIESIVSARNNAIETIAKIAQTGVFETMQETTKQASRLVNRLKSHFPANWPQDEFEKCADLSMQGVPLVLVPRTAIVSKIVAAKGIVGIKQVILHDEASIIEDCEAAIIESTWLSKDMRLHILDSIECYRGGRYRAAQSAANVAFDSLLNEVIDIRAWRRSNGKPRQLSANKVSSLTKEFTDDLMGLPLTREPFYTLLMFPVIGSALTSFDIDNRTTHVNHYNRHMSAHTVSSKQYKKSNALLAIMTVASICKITQLRGKHWMQTSASEYGVDIPES